MADPTLSKTMREALSYVERGVLCPPASFRTLEALRRRGLVTRYTIYSIGADYFEADSKTPQYRNRSKEPYQIHEWAITNKGCEILNGHAER